MFACGQTAPISIAVDSESVYWANSGNGTMGTTISSAPLGGRTITKLASSHGQAFSIAVDATSVYWVAGGDVMRLTPK